MSTDIRITALIRQEVTIPYADFPKLLKAHLSRNPDTPALEIRGKQLRTSTPIKWTDLEAFIRDVCKWGNYASIADRVLQNNTPAEITQHVEDAISKLNSTTPDVVGALESVTKIKQLDVSFGSKHLRFLRPEYCPVLDRILSGRLFYESSLIGYASFVTTCNDIAAKLNGANITCPFPGQATWRPSDVEAALFAWVNEWT